MESLPATVRSGHEFRLLWLIDSLNVGGAEALTVRFAGGLDRERYEVVVCCLASIAGNPLAAELRDRGITFENLDARNLRDVRAFLRLVRLLRRGRFDLVHAHLTYASIWGAIASRITGVPMVATLHVAPPEAGRRARARDWLMRKLLDRWSAGVILVSSALRSSYEATGSLASNRMHVIHNGIDIPALPRQRATSRAFVEREFDLPREARIAVAVAVLRPGKGIDQLLRAFTQILERVPDAWLLVVGDGEMRPEWQRLAKSEGIAEHVRWAGHRRDVDAILAGCDLFVHPTLADAFPTVLLEAMAAGLPVVATNVGGVPEIVEDGVTGTLVPPGDLPALADAVAGQLTRPDDGLLKGRAGREIAIRRFSTAAWLDRLSALYHSVGRRRGGPES